MCHCLNFLGEHLVILQRWSDWRRASMESPMISPAIEFEVPPDQTTYEAPASLDAPLRQDNNVCPQKKAIKARKMGVCMLSDGSILLVKTRQGKGKDAAGISSRKSIKVRKKESTNIVEVTSTYGREPLRRLITNGGSTIASLFTQQGLKGINQDAMLIVENFGARADTVFCGVFDGHGQQGHFISQAVRDKLPLKLASCWQASRRAIRERSLSFDGKEDVSACQQDSCSPGKAITAWKDAIVNAFKLMDRDLELDNSIDCSSSGTTAIALVKQGNHLIIGNVGDSRAVLGTRADDNSLQALQLTVDLKPNVPREAERIRRSRGRIFALREEPQVKRVWLPDQYKPGLAMARSLGDHCLKNFGVISEPDVFYRRLIKKDRFVVLATDGVWDVLSNQQVVEIVARAPVKSLAAKAVVDSAVNVWKNRHPTSKIDDAAVVCLFLDDSSPVSSEASFKSTRSHSRRNRKGIPHIIPKPQ